VNLPIGVIVLAVLALGCGSALSSIAPEVLSDGFPSKPHPAQQRPGKDGRCRVPLDWPPLPTIVKGGGCWVPLDATPEQCAQAQREGGLEVPYEGKCWYPLPRTPEREPTSSLLP
jgi:hypothetical protein